MIGYHSVFFQPVDRLHKGITSGLSSDLSSMVVSQGPARTAIALSKAHVGGKRLFLHI